MSKFGQHTYQEIISQPQTWKQTLRIVQSLRNEISHLRGDNLNSQFIFTGCGSTYYLSWAAASLFQALTGRHARPIPGGELLLYPEAAHQKHLPVTLVAISRSGTTSETVNAVQKFRESEQGQVIVITNNGETPLADLSDMTIDIPDGQEKSVAQTRSFSSMYLAATAFAVLFADMDDLFAQMSSLPSIGEKLIGKCEDHSRKYGENLSLDRFYFLGSGPRYGLACETNLKMKEMALTHSEPFHFFEFRHGPMSMVSETAAVIGLRSSINAKHEQKVLDEMQGLGGQTLTLSDSDADINFESSLPEEIRNVLYLPPLQLMAYYRSVAKGLNPDKPKNLEAVVKLDLE